MPEPVREETIRPLLNVIASDASFAARLDALDFATRLPLDEEAWFAVAGPAGHVLRDAEPGTEARRRALAIAVRIPLLSVRDRLREIAADPDDPDAGALSDALAAVRDPSQVRQLLEAAQQGDDDAFEALAKMPIEDAGITPDEIPPVPYDADPDAQLWRALALARLDRFDALDAVLEAPIDDLPMFWGDPWTPYERIAGVRPVPPTLRQHLLDAYAGDQTGEVGARVVWAATGIADAEGTPIEAHEAAVAAAVAAVWAEVAEAVTAEQVAGARAVSQRALASLRGDEPLSQADYDALKDLPPDEAASLVLDLVDEASRLADELAPHAFRDITLGNAVLDIVQALPATDAWPVAGLVARFGETTPLDDGQMAWIIARAPAGHVVAEAAALIAADTGAGWLMRVADDVAGRAGSPWRGAGPGPGAESMRLPGAGTLGGAALGFGGLIDDRREMAAIGPGPKGPTAPAVTEQRHVHAKIRQDGDDRRTFLAGADNVIRCWIGQPEPEAGAMAEAPIPTYPLPPQGLTLDVVMRWKDQTDRGTVHLPADRTARSNDCDLRLYIPDDERFVSAEIAFLYRGRAFEVVRVEAFVLPPGVVAEPYQMLRVQVQLARREIVELPDSHKVDATLVYAEDRTRAASPGDRGPTRLQVYTDAGGASFDLKDADKLVDYLNKELFAAETSLVRAHAREEGAGQVLDVKNSDTRHILRTLARHGAALYNSLEGDYKNPGERIQIWNMGSDAYSPVEFVYDLGFPTDDATICEEGLAALETDAKHCPRCKSAGELSDDLRIANPVICPFGFWSLQKIIERRDVTPSEAGDASGLSIPLPDRRHLPPIDSVLFASSDKVAAEERDLTMNSLASLLPYAELASSWPAWRYWVADRLPSLLVALPHHGVADGVDYLEIGDEAQPEADRLLYRGQLIDAFVNPARREPGPIVLLLGCRTGAPTDLGYVSLARRFQQLPVSIVLGTLAQILGMHAAPVAREIVTQLAAVDDPEADFGTIMRRVRRRMLARGYLMALCLVALGDAEWRLAPRD